MKKILTIVACVAITGCTTQGMPEKQKLQHSAVQPGATVNVAVDCSISAVNADLGMDVLYPPDISVNERICKTFEKELAQRLAQGDYGRRFSTARLTYTSVGASYQRPEPSDEMLKKLEDGTVDPQSKEWWTIHENYSKNGPAHISGNPTDDGYGKVLSEVEEKISAPTPSPVIFEDLNEKVMSFNIDSARNLGLRDNEFILVYLVTGKYIAQHESATEQAARQAADLALNAAALFMLWAPPGEMLSAKSKSNISVRPILIDAEGVVRWTNDANVMFYEEKNDETATVERSVSASLPLDVFVGDEPPASPAPIEKPANDSKDTTAGPKLLET